MDTGFLCPQRKQALADIEGGVHHWKYYGVLDIRSKGEGFVWSMSIFTMAIRKAAFPARFCKL
jgi:hypothetical protein